MSARKYQTHICQTAILPWDGDGRVDFPKHLSAHVPGDAAPRTAAQPRHPHAAGHPSQTSSCCRLQRVISSPLTITGLCGRDIQSPPRVGLQATVKTRLAHHPGCKLSARGQVLTQSRRIGPSGMKSAMARGKAGGPRSSPSQPAAWLEGRGGAGSAGRSSPLTPPLSSEGLWLSHRAPFAQFPPPGKREGVAGTRTLPAQQPGTAGSASGPDGDSVALPSRPVAVCLAGTQMLPSLPKALPNTLKTLKNS